MIFLLNHYYFINPKEDCIIVEGDYSADDMVAITSAVTFLFEDLVDAGESLSMDMLKKILVDFYRCEDIKNTVTKLCLRNIKLPTGTVYEKMLFSTTNFLGSTMGCIIDLYFARELSCGSEKSNAIMQKWLPEDKEVYEKLKTLLLSPDAIER